MMVVAVMIMVVVVIVVVGDEEIGFDVEDAVEIEGAALEHVGRSRRRICSPRCSARVRVDGADARLDLAQFGRA